MSELLELETLPIHSGTQINLFPVRGQEERLVRVPKDHLNCPSETVHLGKLQEYLDEFLPDPQVVRAQVHGTILELISVQRISSRQTQERPSEVLNRYSKGTEAPIGLARFISACKELHVAHGLLPDLVGLGNLIVWQGKLLLLDLNTHQSHIERKAQKKGPAVEIPVNNEGVPLWDWSLEVLARAETEILHRSLASDVFYASLRDRARQKFLRELTESYLQRRSEGKMC